MATEKLALDAPWLPARKPPQAITREEWRDMAKLAQLFSAPEKGPGVPSAYSRRNYKRLASNQPLPEDLAKARKADLSDEALASSRGPFLLASLAYAHDHAKSESERRELRRIYLDCIRRITARIRLGLRGVQSLYALSWANTATNLAAMADVMKEAGMYVPFARAYIGALLGKQMAAERPYLDMDTAHHLLPICWTLTAHMPDGPEKLHYARLLQRLMNKALAARWPEEYSTRNLLTPDGGGIHHWCYHLHYVHYSLPTVVWIASKLHPTVFRVNAEARRRLRTFMFVHAFATVGVLEVPGNLLAREQVAPLKFGSLPGMIRALAEMGRPDGKSAIDREMAALYLAKVRDWAKDPTAQDFLRAGVKPARLVGHWSLNVTAAALHRRDNWLAVMDGCRRGRRGIEIYAPPGTGNSYSRYFCNGSLMVCATPDAKTGEVTAEASGYQTEGWDWSLIPGATSLRRPFYELASKRPGYVGNNSPFAGGIWLDRDGIWGMDFKGLDVHFKKSAFFFDNRITILTSDITSRVRGRAAATTLFQLSRRGRVSTTILNGRRLHTFPCERDCVLDKPVWLLDNRRNGYYVHPFSARLRVLARTQTWYFLSDMRPDAPPEIQSLRKKPRLTPAELKKAAKYCEPSQGDFAIAFLEHGPTPKAASCAFTVFVQTNPDEMARIARQMAQPDAAFYEILQQDSRAHVVRDRVSKTTGYVLFAANAALRVPGLLVANSRPCFAMLREAGDGILTCSVGATDMSDLSPIVLRLRGRWKAVGAARVATSVEGETTIVTLAYKDYMPIQFTLER